MGTNIRKIIAKKLFESVDNGKLNPTAFQNKVIPSLHLRTTSSHQPSIQLNIKALRNSINNDSIHISNAIANLTSKKVFDGSAITSISSDEKNIQFQIDQPSLLNAILTSCTENPADYRLTEELPENIIVEFSSPNIAKPFHIGHLRSTIIGNFIANVFSAYGHNVTRINYLGDWGTQFGFLKLGMDMCGLSDEEIAKDPIKHLFQAYVKANQTAETDSNFAAKAREIFSQMENGDLPDLEAWTKYRKYTVNEMERVHGRLGVKFDVYAWESDYRKVNILKHLESMRKLGYLQTESDGKESFVLNETTRRPLLKSDGSTLYLTRDVAAIIDRQETFQFDRMYYVAGNEQHHHFESLFGIAQKLGVRNADKLYHVKFGKVEKMSTRKGNVVFLSDILDEMRDLMHTKQIMSPNTKIDLETDGMKTADVQGVSAIIAYELQRMPTANYEFDMDSIIKINLDASASANNFQVTHCRLCSLESTVPVPVAMTYNPKYLHEPEAMQLIFDIARLPDVLHESTRILGAQRLLNYMFSLNTKTKKALKTLSVKGESNVDQQAQRMLLFMSAKNALKACMKLISVTPLEKI